MTDLPYRVDLWFDDACNSIEEQLAACSSIKVARAAYNAAVAERPDRMITLRNRTMMMAQSRPSPPSPGDRVVPLRPIKGSVFIDTDDDEGR